MFAFRVTSGFRNGGLSLARVVSDFAGIFFGNRIGDCGGGMSRLKILKGGNSGNLSGDKDEKRKMKCIHSETNESRTKL